jgi:RNA polymerase sigma-B factor
MTTTAPALSRPPVTPPPRLRPDVDLGIRDSPHPGGRFQRRTDHIPVGRGDPSAMLAALTALPAGHPDRPVLRARVIEAWLGWAHRHAQRYAGRGQHGDDLRQVAALALVKAVDRYDPARGDSFPAYATVTIVGELKRYFRDHTWALRVPRRLQELTLAMPPAREALQQRLQRAPTVDELAAHLGVGPDDIIEALDAQHHYHLMSLNAPYNAADDGDGEIGDLCGQNDPMLESTADRVALGPALSALPARERRILLLRFFGNMTQSQIAAELNLSQMHVSRLITQALVRLRTDLSTQ